MDPENVSALIDRLQQSDRIRKYDDRDRQEAAILAHAFKDLETSFRTFLDEQLPKILNPQISTEELEEALAQIGEEFRHILYHLREPHYFRYVVNDGWPGEDVYGEKL